MTTLQLYMLLIVTLYSSYHYLSVRLCVFIYSGVWKWCKMENYNLDYVIMGTLSMWTLFKGQISFDNLLCLYSSFLGTQSALHSKGGGGVCSIHPFCSPHTRYRWREDRVMKPISFLSQLLIITIILPSHTLLFKSLGLERFVIFLK